MNITMVNCRFGGSKFNLCSLTKMTGSSWKMRGDSTGIYLSKEKELFISIFQSKLLREEFGLSKLIEDYPAMIPLNSAWQARR